MTVMTSRIPSRYGAFAGWFILSLAAACAGCEADKGKNDPGMSARSSAVVPVAEAPGAAPDALLNASAAAAAVASTGNDKRPVIVCFGDSITAGYGVDPALTYPQDMQHDLDAQGLHYRVVNMGVSGETTKDGVARLDAVLARKPEVVVVEFGGNDGLRGLPLADSQRNLTTLVTALRKGGAKVLLVAISQPPEYGQDYITHFQAMFPAVAHQTNVPLLPFAAFAKGVYGTAGNVQDDQIHPTASGDKVLARNVEAGLLPLLRR